MSIFNRRLSRILAGLLAAVVGLLGASGQPVYSQVAIGSVEIVNVTTDSFPAIIIQARVLGSDRLPVQNLPADVITLTEDGIEQDYELRSIDAGSQIAIVVDVGAGSDSNGSTGTPRYLEIRDLILRYIDSMAENDAAMIILQNGNLSVLQPLTSDKEELREAVTDIEANIITQTNGPEAVLRGIQELADISGPTRSQAVLFLSTGIQLGGGQIAEIAAEATAKSIPVFAILSHFSPDDLGPNVRRIAVESGGLYGHYSGIESSIDPVFDAMDQLRVQYTFTYRSRIGTNGQRSVSLEALGGTLPIPRDSIIYEVELQDPLVIFDQPFAGAEYRREAQYHDQNVDSIQPTSATVTAHVEWPDGFPRTISQAQLYINNEEYGSPQLNPGTNLSFAWDLRQYRIEGDNEVQLQIQVVDELGRVALSSGIPVTVILTIPEPPPLPEETCTPDDGIFQFVSCQIQSNSGLIALIVAIPTLVVAILAWRNRGQIVEVAGQAGNAMTHFVARVTRPADIAREANAYLIVLRGDPFMLGRTFPVYANTVTPIGRDKSQVEIVFPDEENSVISRKHCEIRQENGVFQLRDFASTYGTFLNGVKLPELGVEDLHHGDEIGLGPIERGGILLRFEIVMAEEDDAPDDIRDTQPARTE